LITLAEGPTEDAEAEAGVTADGASGGGVGVLLLAEGAEEDGVPPVAAMGLGVVAPVEGVEGVSLERTEAEAALAEVPEVDGVLPAVAMRLGFLASLEGVEDLLAEGASGGGVGVLPPTGGDGVTPVVAEGASGVVGVSLVLAECVDVIPVEGLMQAPESGPVPSITEGAEEDGLATSVLHVAVAVVFFITADLSMPGKERKTNE
jgi:hypothetical protein